MDTPRRHKNQAWPPLALQPESDPQDQNTGHPSNVHLFMLLQISLGVYSLFPCGSQTVRMKYESSSDVLSNQLEYWVSADCLHTSRPLFMCVVEPL